ncbi:TonB-dependent receptor [Porticoccaceae bacterium LTM1]|nr:TonB-dependent receptor [Porticoccaceae bacterium LTM1]
MKLLRKNKLACVVASMISLGAMATEGTVTLNIPSMEADQALLKLSELMKTQIMISKGVDADFSVPELKGEYSIHSALESLLSGTGLTYEITSSGLIVIDNKVADEEQGDNEVEELVVTGSRLKRDISQIASDVIVLDADTLQGMGEATLAGALRRLPQNFGGATPVGNFANLISADPVTVGGAVNATAMNTVNLRGLGSESTLVLVDGKRFGKSGALGGVTDISGIPLNQVERVEVLLDSAAAIYGSDAVGGVVNIILKKDYDGAETVARYGEPTAGGTSESTLNLSFGTAWDTGSASLSYEYNHSSDLRGEERPHVSYGSTPELAGFVPDDPATAGVLINFASSTVALTDIGFGAMIGNVIAQHDGSANINPVANFRYDLDVEVDRTENGTSIIPEQDSHTFLGNISQEINDDVMANFRVRYNTRDTLNAQGPRSLFAVFPGTDPLFGGLVSSVNPFGPFSAPTFMKVNYSDAGIQFAEAETETLNLALSFDGTFSDDWSWSGSVVYNTDENTITNHNTISQYGLYSAIIGETEVQLDPFFGFLPVAASGSTSFTPFNPFDYSSNDQSLIDMIWVGPSVLTSENEELALEFSANGSLFDTSAGTAVSALGVSYRTEGLQSRNELPNARDLGFFVGSSGDTTTTPGFEGDQDIDEDRSITAIFGEVLVPLVSDENALPGIQQLDATGQLRHEQYSDFGGATTYQAGIVWGLVDEVRIRASYGTAFLAPVLNQTSSPVLPPSISPFPITDPQTGVPIPGVLVSSGGNPDLEPQESTSLSMGIEYSPLWLEGLTLKATYHETEFTDRVGSLPGLSFGETNPALEAAYPERYTRAIPGDVTSLLVGYDSRLVNIASVDIAGWDFGVIYHQDTNIGQFGFNLNWAYGTKYEEVLGPDLPVSDEMKRGKAGPNSRVQTSINWLMDNWSAVLDVAYSGETTNRSQTILFEDTASANVRVSYSPQEGILDGFVMTLGGLNITDELQEARSIEDSGVASFYKPGTDDPRGRVVYLEVKKSF